MRTASVLLFLLSVSLACSGQISQYVPAVVGSDGDLVNISVSLIPGEGNVYVSVYPRIGMTTQESIEEAIFYAHIISGTPEECDVLVTFQAPPSTSYIEGPSAGTALTVMTYALLENRTMREDTIITGAVDSAGNVGAVGGLYEKARGAAAMGAKYFITPAETFYEMLLLKKVESQYGITILEARRVDEVIGFMIENRSIEQEPLSARRREIPVLPAFDSSGMGAFGSVAQRMIVLEEEALAVIKESSDETRGIKGFFRNEVQRQTGILEQGYLFSAANEAFLNYIELSTLKVILAGEVDIPRKKGDIGKCLTGISRPVVTDRNSEWVVGADLRQAWAYDRLETVDTSDELLTDEKFIRYNELMYGEAWCNVAKELLSAAPEGGEELDTTAWKQIAEDRLEEARSIETTSGETLSRLGIAEDSYRKGLYGATIYDAVYVIKMEEANGDLTAEVSVEEEVPWMLNETRTSLWGSVYHSHAAFLHSLNESNGAYRTLKLAQGLDEATEEMVAVSRPVEIEEPEVQDDTLFYAVAIGVSTFLFILAVILIRRAFRNGNQKPRKVYRNKYKKG